jgi:hypothetical protein
MMRVVSVAEQMTNRQWQLLLDRVMARLVLKEGDGVGTGADDDFALQVHPDPHDRSGYQHGEIVWLEPRRRWLFRWRKRRPVCVLALTAEGVRCVLYNQAFLERIRQILLNEAPHFGLATDMVHVA